MSWHVIRGLAAATLAGVMLVPVDALAHYRGATHAVGLCGTGDKGWNPFGRNPAQAGYVGPHYGCDCYRAANGRLICRYY